MSEASRLAPFVGVATIALLSGFGYKRLAPTTVPVYGDPLLLGRVTADALVPSFRSFVNPQARSAPIAYISATNAGVVYGYDRHGNVTITISGFLDPSGLFVDSSQNLWVADSGAAAVYVFAKNSLQPFKTLSDPGRTRLT